MNDVQAAQSILRLIEEGGVVDPEWVHADEGRPDWEQYRKVEPTLSSGERVLVEFAWQVYFGPYVRPALDPDGYAPGLGALRTLDAETRAAVIDTVAHWAGVRS